MKLFEIKLPTEVVTLDVQDNGFDSLEIKVEYEHEAASVTRHGDDASFDERQPESVELGVATLASPADQVGEDGELVKTWPIGTNVTKLPGWSKQLERELEKAVSTKLAKRHANRF
jgi:hypothetical protein